MSKFELLKQLEYLIAFQTTRLAEGHWDDFDIAENKIKNIEEEIMKDGSGEMIPPGGRPSTDGDKCGTMEKCLTS